MNVKMLKPFEVMAQGEVHAKPRKEGEVVSVDDATGETLVRDKLARATDEVVAEKATEAAPENKDAAGKRKTK